MPLFDDIFGFRDRDREERFEYPFIKLTNSSNEPLEHNFYENNILKDKFIINHPESNIINKNINIINIIPHRLDDLFDQNNRHRRNIINPINQVDVGGFLSERIGKLFRDAEIGDIAVSLQPLSLQEQVALFDAHSRYIDKTIGRVQEALSKNSNLDLTDEQKEQLRRLVFLKMSDRQVIKIDGLVATVLSGDLEQDIKALQDKTYFTSEQKRAIESASLNRNQSDVEKAMFQNGDRLYFKIKVDGQGKTQAKIEALLNEKGYTITDYAQGLATESAEERQGKQTFKIGRLIKDDEGLLKEFNDDPFRAVDNVMVVLSRNTDDIARMSTNRGWVSCMSNDGINFEYVPRDIRAGTMIAYLTSLADPYLHDPLSRVSLKPFTKSSAAFGFSAGYKQEDVIFRPGPCYGIPHAIFYKAIQTYAEKVMNQGKEGKFELHDGLYGDCMKRVVTRLAPAAPFAQYA